MDRRSWPWKKKSSDKAAAEKAAAAADAAAASLSANASQSEQESYKKPKYVQISVEQYAHLTGLEDEVKSYEDHVKTLEDQINELEEKLSAANTEMTNKDNLVKQHAKVAEEAVSGWEKAEAEAVALKTHLETVTLSKLTVEDRAAHLDGALKECMRQIRNLKEENEQKLQDLAVTKNKQCEKIKHELEARLADLDQDLRRAAAENAAISRSLQERSNMLIKISEEKTQAEAEIELLKGNIESCEREINSLKYELHVSAKELEIRTEEKNMSMRSAEVANKQHVEGVKKIAKLEAECQRLRGLVRKKLPGPAALAQMKMEVESLGRDYGDTRVRRSPVKPSSPHLSPVTEFSLDHVQKYQKENEFLAERLLATEEETKMLKEALAKRNSELQVSRSMYAKAASRLQSLEAQIQINGQHKTSPKSIQISTEGSFSHNTSHPASLTSMSEDGNDDDRSCAEPWATGKANKAEKSNHLNLMDDFLEMEKLACLSNDSNGPVSVSNSTISKTTEVVNHDASEVISGKDIQTEQKSGAESAEHSPGTNAEQQPLMKLRSRISTLLESVSKDTDVGNILEDIKHAIQETHSTLHTETSLSDDEHQSDGRSDDRQANPEDAGLTTGKEISLSQPVTETGLVISKDLAAAISQIHDFVLFLGKEAMGVHDTFTEGNEFSQRIEEFSITFKKAIGQDLSLIDFVLDLSRVLAKASELRFNVLGFKGNRAETNSPDCIDKVALPENKILRKDSNEIYQNGCTSDPEVSDDGNIVSGYKSNVKASKISLEEFEQLKSEKENLLSELARCTENLEMTKSQLRETDQLLAEAKSQLASAQKSNSLSETQLKCMAESYRSLESRAAELETELNLLIAKTESIETELQDEKKNHHDALSRCKELQDQLLRNESNLENEVKTNQEKELAAAAEKLSEFQETIFLLGKQLKNFHPQSDFMGSPYNERSQKIEMFNEEEPTTSGINMTDHADLDTTVSPIVNRVGAESPVDVYNGPLSPSDAESSLLKSPINSKNPRQKSPISGSSSSSSNAPTPEKHSRGFSRFFSSKGKNGY